ncbi:hypothetical protein EX895_002067 [Sporisorium graminicola]|uniref:Uncharacterized protein n=1 Tax=Sporisorium graminicola TaxID=280036 RepID=A0A4U7KX27_9BASI|nr:hypothetical protein EX895_002067 [Sporisorium graminicola]TKY88826.1 hypothetical protein EX895_002067 [Sporisorium graminicola]
MTVRIDSTRPETPEEPKVLGELLFTYADDELGHDPSIYHQSQTPQLEKPKRSVWKQLLSLRPELESIRALSDDQQLNVIRSNLAQRGFATLPHHSAQLAERGIDTQADYSAFIKENQDLMKKITGADQVIVWNTARRESTVSESASLRGDYERQRRPQGIESRYDMPLEPPAVYAHIDQDHSWGAQVCSMAIAGTPSLLSEHIPLDPFQAIEQNLSNNYSRTMIINLWRPVCGTVYDKPLAVADYRSLTKASLSRHANYFGCGFDIHEHATQKWHFIPQQTNDELLIFKCYDSLSLQQQQLQSQGSDVQVEALYGAHCAVTNLKGHPTPPPNAPPRRSVEIRFVAVWR